MIVEKQNKSKKESMAHLWITPADMHRAKVHYQPKIPPSKIYDYTYGYSMNYYQPMIDYLDRKAVTKESQRSMLQLPHLPWTNERYIKKYDPKNPVKLYSKKEIADLTKSGQESACRNINNFDVKHSYFSCIPTADATHLRRQMPKSSVLESLYRKDVGKTVQDIKDLEMDAYYRYKEGERRLIEDDRANFSVDLKRALKGKSANQISYILLNDSTKNIRNSCEQDAIRFRQCTPTARTVRAARSLSESRPANNYEDRMDIIADKTISNTLQSVKKEISTFTNRTEEFLSDTRYRLHLIKLELREQEDFLAGRLRTKEMEKQPIALRMHSRSRMATKRH